MQSDEREMVAVGAAPDFYFAERGVLVELVYSRKGEPIAVLRGKAREKDRDMELLLAWMRALKRQIEAGPSERITTGEPGTLEKPGPSDAT